MWQEEVLRDMESAANPDKAPAMAAYRRTSLISLAYKPLN